MDPFLPSWDVCARHTWSRVCTVTCFVTGGTLRNSLPFWAAVFLWTDELIPRYLRSIERDGISGAWLVVAAQLTVASAVIENTQCQGGGPSRPSPPPFPEASEPVSSGHCGEKGAGRVGPWLL